MSDRAGNVNFISINIDINDVAPINEYINWNYKLNDTDNTIMLNRYIGSETDVIVYRKYMVNEKLYDARIKSNDSYDVNEYMFADNNNIKTITFCKNINTTNITNMAFMFDSCSSLTNIKFNDFDTSNVIIMFSMFSSCTSLKNIDLRSFNTSNVKNMNSMFYGCTQLEHVYVSDKWDDTQALKQFMFEDCKISEVTFVD